MAVFHYEAYDQDGKSYKGVINASTFEEAKIRLHKQGILVRKIEDSSDKLRRMRMSSGDLVHFLWQLSQLMDAGFALYEALIALSECLDKKYQPLIIAICEYIHMGRSFSQAMEQFPQCFDECLCAIVAASEEGGNLSSTLRRTSTMLGRQEQWKKQMITALIYPCILLSMSLGVVILMLTVVVPSLEPLFESRQLSNLTYTVLLASRFVRSQWAVWSLLVLGTSAFFTVKWVKGKGRIKSIELLLSVPLVNKILLQSTMARFSHMMAMLIDSGVSLIDALQLASRLLISLKMQKEILAVRDDVMSGQQMSSSLSKISWIPMLAINMIRIGEQSGSLSQMFFQMSQFYDDQLNKNLTRLTTLAQPVILLVMGVIVGILMAAILLPLTDLSQIQGF